MTTTEYFLQLCSV